MITILYYIAKSLKEEKIYLVNIQIIKNSLLLFLKSINK